MSKKKSNYSAEFKARVVMELIIGQKTLNELAEQYQIAPASLSIWNKQFQERSAEIFQQGSSDSEKKLKGKEQEITVLQQKVGQLLIADHGESLENLNENMDIYNNIRPHASLGAMTPNAFCQQLVNKERSNSDQSEIRVLTMGGHFVELLEVNL